MQWDIGSGNLPLSAKTAALPAYKAYAAKYPGVDLFVKNLANAHHIRPPVPQYTPISVGGRQGHRDLAARPRESEGHARPGGQDRRQSPVLSHGGGRGGGRPRPPAWRRALPENLTGWSFVLPASIIVLGLGFFPVIWSFLLSTKAASGFGPEHSVGLANYRELAHDPEWLDAVSRSLKFTLLYVPTTVLHGPRPGAAAQPEDPLHRLLPHVLLRAVRGLGGGDRRDLPVRRSIRSTASSTTASHGWDSPASSSSTTPTGRSSCWRRSTPGRQSASTCLIYLAALQDVPADQSEAARIDGAGSFGVFRHVILPAVRPITVLAVVWETINALQFFDLAWTTKRGGPIDATTVIIVYGYKLGFVQGQPGLGAAVACVLFLGHRRARAAAGRSMRGAGGSMSSEAVAERGRDPGRPRAARPAQPPRRRRPSAWHLLLAPLSLIFIFPFVQMLFASLMTTAEINAYPPRLFPHHPTLDGYRTVLQESDFSTWFKNSLIVDRPSR